MIYLIKELTNRQMAKRLSCISIETANSWLTVNTRTVSACFTSCHHNILTTPYPK